MTEGAGREWSVYKIPLCPHDRATITASWGGIAEALEVSLKSLPTTARRSGDLAFVQKSAYQKLNIDMTVNIRNNPYRGPQ